MLEEQIVVGKAYVNERARVIREVTEEVEEGCVKFNAFALSTGRLLPSRHRVCETREMARWAQREASPSETARVHPYQRDAWSGPGAHTDERGLQQEAAKAAREAASGPYTLPQVK